MADQIFGEDTNNGTENHNYMVVNDDGSTNSRLLTSEGKPVDVQYPLATNGDSVYAKDIWVDQSVTTDWVDTDATGLDVALIPVTNLHTRITNSTTDNPKTILFHFNRSVFATQVGLGCVGGDDFSNVKVVLLGSGGVERTIFNDSANNTKYTSRNYTFTKQLFNAVRLEFHTVDTVCLSNVTIQKTVSVSVAQVEKTTDSLQVISYSHAELHSGNHYHANKFETLAKNATRDILIVTPDTPRWAHMILEASTTASPITATLYEGVTTSNDGVIDGARNRNRNFPDNNTTIVYDNPVVTDLGDLLHAVYIGSGRGDGDGARDAEEILLKQNTKYLFRIVEQNVTATVVSWVFDWYEHTNKI